MGLDEYIPSSDWIDESWWTSAEQVKEASEQYRKQASKAAAWIKRTLQDEKKAKTYDMLLAGFLVKIIVNEKYNVLLDSLITLIHSWYPSNFILGVMSIVYPDISNKIRELINKEKVNFNYKSKDLIIFEDKTLDPQVKNRINNWIEDIVDSVSIEYSSIMTKRLINYLETDERIINFIANVFIFFLKNINVKIEASKAKNIAEFIVGEVLSKIKKLKLEEV